MIARLLLFVAIVPFWNWYSPASSSERVIAAIKLLPILVPYQTTDYAKLKAEAEKFYAEKSFSRAHELYLQADRKQVATAEARWIEFRLADTLWRAQASTNTNDDTKLQQARQQLESLVKEGIGEAKERDLVWAETHESLGDLFWTRNNSRNYTAAWPHYQQALDYWAGTKEIETARQRYLQIVWTMADPPNRDSYYYYGYYGNHISLDILSNVLKIANNDNDKARAHYLMAMTIRQQYGDAEQRQRAPEEFDAALKAGKTTDWYDDALYHYAEWMMNQGRTLITPEGGWRQEQDFVKALELFQRLTSEFSKGETRYFDQAKSYAENITKPSLSVNTSNVFLPDSEMQFYLNWRNVKQVNLALYKVDLTRDIALTNRNENWLQSIPLNERIKSWTKQTNDKGDYKPGQEVVRLDSKLPIGAYVIEATAGEQKARDLLLVTDTTLVIKSAGKQTLVYFCNAIDGSPVANATIKLWAQDYENNQTIWRTFTQQTNQEGIAMIDLRKNQNSSQLFVAASLNNRQAFSQGYSYDYNRNDERWKIYAFTDRPAYRPKETVNWKFVARQYSNGTYSTPANQTIEYEITDPKGTKVKEGKATLNAFGSAWGSLEIADNQPLGQYNIQFYDAGRKNGIGSAQLFRIEEYKLPEFKVAVSTPEENGQKKAFKLGEKVEVQVQADYYFGGTVNNADIELVVHQNPFYHYYRPTRDYDWYYEDQRRNYYGGRNGQIIKREKIKTDANGKATFSFDTPRGYGQDLEYFIEARVTDSSRREITGSGTVRVTRQRYYVYPQAKHNLYRPNDKVATDIKALDANNKGVQVEGTIKVTRDFWYEIWLDANGREVKGEELKRLNNQARLMRQAVPPANWKLKFRGYQRDDIATQTIKTNDKGEAEFSFTPAREGYYRIAWSSSDKGTSIIRGETAMWVTTNATTELGYRHGGLEIIVDQDTARAGQKTPVMITTPVSNRYVLFSVEGESLMSYQLLHLDGTAKLIELPLETKHEPNVFLSAAMVNERQLFTDTKQLIVPPDRHFLNVEVTANQSQYQPREEGTLTVMTKDRDGKPVSAEVSLGLVDESVFYIQSDLAGDPRKFYYGQKRGQYVQTQSSFQQKQYLKLVEGDNKQLMDDRQIASGRKDEATESRDQFVVDLQVKERSRQQGQQDMFRIAGPPMPSAAPMAVTETVIISGGAMAADSISSLPMNGRNFNETLKLEAGAGTNEFRGGLPSREPNVVVRNDFRSTVFWQPDVVTNKDGKATVKVKYPDSTTSWKATARAATSQNQFGIGDSTTRTKMPLLVRLQAPRFFVAGDRAVVSAIVSNNTDEDLEVSGRIKTEGVGVEGVHVSKPNKDTPRIEGWPAAPYAMPSPEYGIGATVIPAHGETRFDWLVRAGAGNAKIRVSALSKKYTDAMERSFVVHEHGIEKFLAKSGKLRGDEVTINLDLPKERKAEATNLTVQVTPSLAVTMLDALPYLIDYPYGCVEQTMSRYLPAAITAKTLKDLKLDPEEAMSKVFGGIERQFVGKTQPQGARSLHQVDELVQRGLERLYDMQHADGGWGWWKEGESDHFMTAYVVWGLTLGQAADVRCKDDVLARGAAWLDKELVEEENNFDQQAWMLHALASYHKTKPTKFQQTAFDNLWTNREKLNAYTRALLALSAHHFGFADKAKILVQNLENGVKRDNAPDTLILIRGEQKSDASTMGTAHWGEDGLYYRWSDGGVEATAWALRALLAIDPNNKLIEPVTNWLIKNRRGAQWSNTRDTAMVVLTMNEYLRTSGELNAAMEYDVFVNGQAIATKKLTPAEVFSAPSQFAIKRELLKDGANEIRIARKSGKGALYFAANAQFFSREENIKAAGNEIFVKREYYKLVGRPTLLKGYVYDKVKLAEGETVNSGDRIETVLTIEAKNNYEYLLFEDLKPAGFEAVQLQSGKPLYAHQLKQKQIESTSTDYRLPTTDYSGRFVYQELRDRKVALFLDKLPEGVWQIRYEMRAETPGQFHALPVLGHAMYVPEIRCNGEELKVMVVEP
ncbi:MAG: alpha-2-macroglobulin [Blastocatellia bacterium]|nr:alpha-2-macroglobulin [Blastocatellia bacterium]